MRTGSRGRRERLATSAALVLCVGLLAGLVGCTSDAGPKPVDRESLVSVPWELVSKDGSRLEIRITDGGCFVFERTDVEESDDQIVVTALARNLENSLDDPASPVACVARENHKAASVSLKEPVGNREVKPAPVSSEWTDSGK